MSFTIREYTDADFEAVRKVYLSVNWTAYTDHPEVLRNALANSARCVVAESGGEVVGLYRAISDHHTIAYLQDILVNPSYQRQGLGSQLMEHFLQNFGHVRQIMLLTDSSEKTHAFYTSHGLTRVEGNLSAYCRL